MEKSRKILLYGLVSSILLIIFCLYSHRSEFINVSKEEPLIEQVVIENEVEKNRVNQESSGVKLVLKDRTEEEPTPEVSPTQKPAVVEENMTTVVEQTTLTEANETLDKVKEKPVEMADENLPPLDNFPIFDEGSVTDDRNSTTIENTQTLISNIVKSEQIHFYKNRSKLTNKSKKTLDKIVEILKRSSNVEIIVKGYTDASGRRKMNRWVSSERAKSVKSYLVNQGIASESIEVKGFGENGLLYPKRPYSRLNRRVEIEVKRR